jgi:hypothetical protein
MISSWYDKKDKNERNAEVMSQNPPYNGLNDCAHFVTQSLAAGGIHVATTGVSVLFHKLHSVPDTKMLAKQVEAEVAEPIVESGIMHTGDVIIYSLGNEHHHSVVYMGNAKIAMHTWANHPDHPTLHGDWKASATGDHPLVTLIHFGRDDAVIPLHSPILGWWKVLTQGQTFYYHFERSGRVGYTSRKPAKLDHPIHAPEGKGYWFLDHHRLKICWTVTGGLEVLNAPGPGPHTHLEGTGVIKSKIVADKLS